MRYGRKGALTHSLEKVSLFFLELLFRDLAARIPLFQDIQGAFARPAAAFPAPMGASLAIANTIRKNVTTTRIHPKPTPKFHPKLPNGTMRNHPL